VWRKNFGSTTALPSGDGNGDRIINTSDHSVWRANFGASLPSPGAAGSATVAAFSTASIEVGQSKTPAHASNQSTTARVSSFAEVETQPTRGISSKSSIAHNESVRVGRHDGDDLLLLATDRMTRSSRRDSFEPLRFRNDDEHVNDTHRQSLIDESFDLAHEVWR